MRLVCLCFLKEVNCKLPQAHLSTTSNGLCEIVSGMTLYISSITQPRTEEEETEAKIIEGVLVTPNTSKLFLYTLEVNMKRSTVPIIETVFAIFVFLKYLFTCLTH